MEFLVKRGISHIIKKIPLVKPEDLTQTQSEYYDYLHDGKCSEIFTAIVKDIETIDVSDETLWLALILRRKLIIRRYLSKEKRDIDKFIQLCIDNDVFEFIGIVKSTQLMMKRLEEKQYFKLVRDYYKEIVSVTMKADPVSFFDLDEEQLKFLRTVIGIDTSKVELSSIAYKIYKSGEHYLLGIPIELQTSQEFVYLKYLEMSKSMVEYYDKLRKHTELFLNSIGIKFVNSIDTSGKEIVDYPWFRLVMKHVQEDLVQIFPIPNTKPFSYVYTMTPIFEIIEDSGQKYVKVEDFPLVQMTSETGEIKNCNKKFLEHFQIQ